MTRKLHLSKKPKKLPNICTTWVSNYHGKHSKIAQSGHTECWYPNDRKVFIICA